MKLHFVATVGAIMMSVSSAKTLQANGTYSENCHYYAMYGVQTMKYAGAKAWLDSDSGPGPYCGKDPHLATISSAGENFFLADMIKDLDDKYPWIGGQDTLVEGVFVWETGEPWGVYTNWGFDPPQPDNAFGREEDCVQIGYGIMNAETGLFDYWNDLPCDYRRTFLAEWDCECGWDGGVSGDPHFKTWTGEKYDFHGVCDLVLLQNPGFAENLGMDIHIRTKQTLSWSYISAAVLRIGEHTLEVMGGEDNSVTYWLDGVENSELHDLAGYAVTYTRTNSLQHTFDVALGDEGAGSITIQTFKNFVRVDMHGVKHENFADSYGLMGAFGSGAKVARDKVTHIDDTIEFGMMWQVLPEEGNLFHNLEGPQAPEQCFIPKAKSLRRRLSEADVTIEDAESACSRVDPDDFDICVFDVIATNDRELAGAY